MFWCKNFVIKIIPNLSPQFSYYQELYNGTISQFEHFHNMVHYKTVLDMRWLIGGPKSVVSKEKCIDYIEKWPFMVIFLYNLYIFVWIQHGYLSNTFFALDPGSSVIKRLWYNQLVCWFICWLIFLCSFSEMKNIVQVIFQFICLFCTRQVIFNLEAYFSLQELHAAWRYKFVEFLWLYCRLPLFFFIIILFYYFQNNIFSE